MKANIFEIGACGPSTEYLIRHPQNWAEVSQARVDRGEHIIIPLEFKDRYKRVEVFLVEPLPSIVDGFFETFGAEYQDNMYIIQCAIGGTNTIRYMQRVEIGDFYEEESGEMAHFPEYFFQGNQGPGFYIQTLTLDTLFQSLNAYPQILSVDVEGAEIETFKAYSFDPPPDAIIIDYHKYNLEPLAEILESHNYRIVDTAWQGDGETLLAYPKNYRM